MTASPAYCTICELTLLLDPISVCTVLADSLIKGTYRLMLRTAILVSVCWSSLQSPSVSCSIIVARFCVSDVGEKSSTLATYSDTNATDVVDDDARDAVKSNAVVHHGSIVNSTSSGKCIALSLVVSHIEVASHLH